MNPQQDIPNPNAAMQPQPTIEQLAAAANAAPNIAPQPVAGGEAVAPAEMAPMPGQSINPLPINPDPTQPDPATLTTAPPAQVIHTGAVQGRTLQEQDLASLTAGDDDLIEKEWVDKAEDVIEKDEDDPYIEDADHHTMNKSYIKKRFNLDVS